MGGFASEVIALALPRRWPAPLRRHPSAGAKDELRLPSSTFGVFMKLSISLLSW